jgi:hypothetical protein
MPGLCSMVTSLSIDFSIVENYSTVCTDYLFLCLLFMLCPWLSCPYSLLTTGQARLSNCALVPIFLIHKNLESPTINYVSY